MNVIVNKLLLAGDRFMPEMHLRFAYIACGPFTKNKERIRKSEETGDSRYIYQKQLDKACFQHDMADGDFNPIQDGLFRGCSRIGQFLGFSLETLLIM